MKKLFLLLFFANLFCPKLYSDEARVIKVSGQYGIINKGLNKGFAVGQILYVKRETAAGLVEVGKVKVIRSTANRAAVKRLTNGSNTILQKGDRLFTAASTKRVVRRSGSVGASPEVGTRQPRQRKSSGAQFVSWESTAPDGSEIPLHEPISIYSARTSLRRPWLGVDVGTIVPTGSLAQAFSSSFRFGASYMVAAGHGINVGIEISNSFLSNTALGGGAVNGVNDVSASILQGLVVFQAFFGNHIFFETGGGLYRPQIKTVTANDLETTFSSTNFGIFGGTGFFMPTSEFAGFTLKGRLHNYFNGQSRQFYGITGGFRFKLNGYK
ncbi:MAG: hypothetical protein ACE5HO_01335 [bacterium]